ncbi:MAG: hypothetical protein R3A45_05155 [Bdellovibrionota bacterium]
MPLESKDLAEQPNVTDEKTFKKLETFSKVLGYLEQNYIDRLDNEILIEQAIKGMVQNLDPHTVYLTKDEYTQMKVDTSGKFGGIGIEMGINESKELYIIKPMETGPAIHQGVKANESDFGSGWKGHQRLVHCGCSTVFTWTQGHMGEA